jgi:hypothetical protein
MKRLDLIAAVHARKDLHASSVRAQLEITNCDLKSARPTALVAQGSATNCFWRLLPRRFLRQRPRRFQHLFRSCADAEVAGEIAPADGAGAVDEELGGAGDVASVFAGALVQDAVARDRLRVRIGEQWEGVAGFLTQIARLLRRVDADRNRLDAGGAEVGEMLFDTP